MGPLLLARLLDLNEVQAGVLNIAFKVADDQGLLLLDLKDLRALLSHVADNAKRTDDHLRQCQRATRRRNPARPAAAESQGGEKFFGEPALELNDLMMADPAGYGAINILAADQADAESARLRHLPAVAAVGAVRGSAGGRRSG